MKHRGLFKLSGLANSTGPILIGEHFPKHLQVAYGRGVYHLLHEPGPHFGLNFLRDLPLNLSTLCTRGYPHALAAYRAECVRTGIEPII
jgi:hypothetical protein